MPFSVTNPIVHIQDDFFESGTEARELILSTVFQDVISPIDNVTYPGINLEITSKVKEELVSKIERLLDTKIIPRFVFARVMIEGRPVPNKVHSDFNMGEYSALVYMSPSWPEHSGTSFFKHLNQGLTGTTTTDWTQISHNSMELWTRYASVQAKFNRILIHKASYWHMAEPQNAWGNSADNGRLVLTMFFDVESK